MSCIHLYGERPPPPPPKSDFYSDCDAIVKLDYTSVFRLSAKMLGRITDNNLLSNSLRPTMVRLLS